MIVCLIDYSHCSVDKNRTSGPNAMIGKSLRLSRESTGFDIMFVSADRCVLSCFVLGLSLLSMYAVFS